MELTNAPAELKFDREKTDEPPSRVVTWARRAARELPIMLLFAFSVLTGFRGVDLGYHWDEVGWHLRLPHEMVAGGVFLPRSYVYPALTRWLVILPTVPAGVRAGLTTKGEPSDIFNANQKTPAQIAMLAVMDAPNFLLSARRVYIVVSALAIVWIYAAVRALRYKRWQALATAAAFGLSWDFACHARWVVPDTILAQFAALTLFMLALFRRTGRTAWLYAAAAAAGLATGTKYPGVVLLVPVILAGAFRLPFRERLAQVKSAAILCAVAFGTFLLTTPGVVLEPFLFLKETQWISGYYAGAHGGYTAKSALDHARIALMFLSLSYFSPYMVLAALLSGGVIAGAVLWFRKDWRFAAVVLSFPVSFLVAFCARYRVTIDRNYLFLTPFLAIFLAPAFAAASDRLGRLPKPWPRWAFMGALAAVFAANAVWLFRAAEGIRHVDPKNYVRDALAYVKRHPGERFRISPQVKTLANEQKVTIPTNVTTGTDAQHVVFFARAEGPDSWHWKANDPWLMEKVFGPREINFTWTTGWAGHDRVVVMTRKRAKDMGVGLAQ